MGTHRQGRRRRSIRRLTRRTIPLPTEQAASGREPVQEELVLSEPPPEEPASASQPPPSASVASSLAELRLPDAKAAAEGGESAAAAVSDSKAAAPECELLDDEPATNPKLSLVPLPSSVTAPETKAKAKAKAEAEDRPISEPPAAVDESELEPADTADSDGSVDVPLSEPARADAETPAPRADSDMPTRPRIELSPEMALAAGRVTSLDMPPIAVAEAAPRRGSKLPPSAEPRIISSLTGRRRSIPGAAEEDDRGRP